MQGYIPNPNTCSFLSLSIVSTSVIVVVAVLLVVVVAAAVVAVVICCSRHKQLRRFV